MSETRKMIRPHGYVRDRRRVIWKMKTHGKHEVGLQLVRFRSIVVYPQVQCNLNQMSIFTGTDVIDEVEKCEWSLDRFTDLWHEEHMG